MKKTREELRQALRQTSEILIEEILDWYETNETPNMSQIEAHVLNIREKLGQETARLLIQSQEAVHLSTVPLCPKCQQRMRYKGNKEKSVDGLIGLVNIKRAYYYCPLCQEGFFPPG
ncbi:MAG TPA: hypothetical protein ENJ93_07525 [Chloroflexi bacterium]|nr:hypothetical protein [Chloroflexota bacterium]